MHTHAHTYTHAHAHTRVHAYTCTHAHTRTRTHAHTHAHAHMHTHAHTRARIHMHACTHTRTHTCTHTSGKWDTNWMLLPVLNYRMASQVSPWCTTGSSHLMGALMLCPCSLSSFLHWAAPTHSLAFPSHWESFLTIRKGPFAPCSLCTLLVSTY
jgi:hypothetical protein